MERDDGQPARFDDELVIVIREELGWSSERVSHFVYLGRFMVGVRTRCCRHSAPATLRARILGSLPQRETDGV